MIQILSLQGVKQVLVIAGLLGMVVIGGAVEIFGI